MANKTTCDLAKILTTTHSDKNGKEYERITLIDIFGYEYSTIKSLLSSEVGVGDFVEMLHQPISKNGKTYSSLLSLRVLKKATQQDREEIEMTLKKPIQTSGDTTEQGTKSKGFKKIFAEGVAMYAKVHTPSKNQDPTKAPTYTLDLIVDEENAQILMDNGLRAARKILNKDTDEEKKVPKEYAEYPRQKVFSLKRTTKKLDGTVKTPLNVVDSKLNNIPPNILIGNGSKVKVLINPYTTTFAGKQVNGHDLLEVQVLELVPYTSGTNFTATEGFTIGGNEEPGLLD